MNSKGHEQFSPAALLRWIERREGEIVSWISKAVAIESPSFNKPAVDKMAEFLAESFEQAGGKTKLHRQGKLGNHLQVDFAAGLFVPQGTFDIEGVAH